MTTTRDLVFLSISKTLDIPEESLTEDMMLSELSTDSIKLFELFLQLEELLGQNFEFEDIEHIKTIGCVVEFAERLLKNGAKGDN